MKKVYCLLCGKDVPSKEKHYHELGHQIFADGTYIPTIKRNKKSKIQKKK